MGAKYDDYDWDELTEEAKQAAIVLGYTKKIWDKDEDTDTTEKDWDDLTAVEKAAAETLGYTKKSWDK